AVALILSISTSSTVAHDSSVLKSFKLIVIALVALVALAALALTRSRSGFIGMAAGILTFACFVLGKMGRRVILLVGILAALGGSFYVHQLLQTGGGQQRAQSIRSRLMYEWPYALHLFLQKPVAGNGDGAYAMLAGKFAREDQLDDPATL